MPADLAIRIRDDVRADDRRELDDALDAFNIASTGHDDYRAATCILRDADGRLLAGVDGYTWGGMAYLATVWVAEGARGDGLGRRLVDAFEDEARARGCATVVLASFDFQAPGFYEHLGYEIVGTTTDTPAGHREHILQKSLRPSA